MLDVRSTIHRSASLPLVRQPSLKRLSVATRSGVSPTLGCRCRASRETPLVFKKHAHSDTAHTAVLPCPSGLRHIHTHKSTRGTTTRRCTNACINTPRGEPSPARSSSETSPPGRRTSPPSISTCRPPLSIQPTFACSNTHACHAGAGASGASGASGVGASPMSGMASSTFSSISTATS